MWKNDWNYFEGTYIKFQHLGARNRDIQGHLWKASLGYIKLHLQKHLFKIFKFKFLTSLQHHCPCVHYFKKIIIKNASLSSSFLHPIAATTELWIFPFVIKEVALFTQWVTVAACARWLWWPSGRARWLEQLTRNLSMLCWLWYNMTCPLLQTRFMDQMFKWNLRNVESTWCLVLE